MKNLTAIRIKLMSVSPNCTRNQGTLAKHYETHQNKHAALYSITLLGPFKGSKTSPLLTMLILKVTSHVTIMFLAIISVYAVTYLQWPCHHHQIYCIIFDICGANQSNPSATHICKYRDLILSAGWQN